MSEHLWDELESTVARLDRLRRELGRCTWASPHKADIERQIELASRRRDEIIAALRKAASDHS